MHNTDVRKRKLCRDWQLRAWQLAVFEQDNWTCQYPDCGANTCLDAAHIVAKSQAPSRKFDPANGVTLCRSHHEHFHQHPIEWHKFIGTFTR